MPIQINDINVIDDDRNIIASGIVTVGSGSSATIINGTTGIVNVGTGITMDGISGNISIAGTITVGGINFPPNVVSFNPTDGATDVSWTTNIVITFDQSLEKPTTGIGTTANITLRNSSGIGTIIQTIPVSSAAVTISGAEVTINPPSDLPVLTDVYVVVDEGAFVNINIGSPTPLINTYNFETQGIPALGSSFEGGYLICQAGGTLWIVAPSSSEVSRSFYSRGDANTRAQQVSGCTGWFVPICSQLLNPGYSCRTYWDSYCTTCYWTSSQGANYPRGVRVDFATGSAGEGYNKPNVYCVRSFRCVTY